MNANEREIFSMPQIEAEPAQSKRALAAVIELQGKINSSRQGLERARQERDRYAFDAALSNGESPARRSLRRLQSEIVATESELEVLHSALATAHQRLAGARAAAKQSQAVTDARRAEEVAEQLRAKGVECSELLTAFANRYGEFADLIGELHELGFAPNTRLVHLSAERALSSALLPTRLAPNLGMLPPSQRITMSVVAETYASQAITQARRVIDGEAA